MASHLLDIGSILLAIHLSAPGLKKPTANYYAKTIQKESARKEIDPLLVISIVDHESRWNTMAVSKDMTSRGLMQITTEFAPKSAPYLFEGGTNIRVGISFLDSAREFCIGYLDREPEVEEYLSCFQGSCGRVNHRCQPTKMTKRVMAYRECLEQCLIEGVSRDCEQLYVEMPYR